MCSSIEILQIAVNCLQKEANDILNVSKQLDNNFIKAINIIKNCKGKVILIGVGKSGHIANKIAATLSSTGTPAFSINPLDAYHGDLGVFTKDDIVIALSHSGRTEELIRVIQIIFSREIPIISLTGDLNSPLAEYSDAILNLYIDREADPLNLAPTSSTTVALAMGDALAIALMKVKNFTANDFAKHHPGGELGKILFAVAINESKRKNNENN